MAPPVEPPGLDLSRLLVISPHFDDTVFSCGHLLAAAPGAVVVTVFGGRPETYRHLCARGTPTVASGRNPTSWPCVARKTKRRSQRSTQYRSSSTSWRVSITDRLDTLHPRSPARSPTSCVAPTRPRYVLPLAIRHHDHRLTMAAALRVRTPNERRHWIGYGEFPYVWRRPDGEAAHRPSAPTRGRGDPDSRHTTGPRAEGDGDALLCVAAARVLLPRRRTGRRGAGAAVAAVTPSGRRSPGDRTHRDEVAATTPPFRGTPTFGKGRPR